MKVSEKIAQAAEMACILEVSAPKPGNVNRQYDFVDTRFEEFLLSAVAIRPAFQTVSRARVGQIIWQAVRDTQRLVKTNTNLGIVLLLAPLAKGCFQVHRLQPSDSCVAASIDQFRKSVARILVDLTVEDARLAYAAIRLAQPGGMGHSKQADIAEEPAVNLYYAMALAQERDTIAKEYVTEFAVTFEIGYPALESAWKACGNLTDAIVQSYLTILARIPDTLIARKRGIEKARWVSQRANEILEKGDVFSEQGRKRLVDLDHQLRNQGHTLNPGTTADLTTASLFLFLLDKYERLDQLFCSLPERH